MCLHGLYRDVTYYTRIFWGFVRYVVMFRKRVGWQWAQPGCCSCQLHTRKLLKSAYLEFNFNTAVISRWEGWRAGPRTLPTFSLTMVTRVENSWGLSWGNLLTSRTSDIPGSRILLGRQRGAHWMLQTEAPYYTATLHDTCTGHTELGNAASLHVVFDHR